MEENNKAIVPIIRVNITASRVRVKLFNLVRYENLCEKQQAR
jgi:hypothetical protein